MKTLLLVCAIGSTVAACASAPRPAPEVVDANLPAPPPLSGAMLPARTQFVVELQAALSAQSSRIGDTFTVTVADAIIAQNGDTVVPAGSVITGMVTGVHSPAAVTEPAVIRLNFLRIRIRDATHPLSAVVVNAEPDSDANAVGAVVTDDQRDRLVAGALGIGAGTIVSLGTAPDAAVLAQGSRLTIRTLDMLDLRT